MTRTTRAMMPLFFPRRTRGPAARGEALKMIIMMMIILMLMIISNMITWRPARA